MAFGVLAAAPVAHANDTTAALAAGGLVYVINESVAMQSEDLSISEDAVRVHYVFKNTTDADVKLLVAFPMPDVTIAPETNISIPVRDADNFLAFETKVDGAPVETAMEQRVFALGIDRTALLRARGVPLAPFREETQAALDKLPPAAWDEFIGMGLAFVDEYDAGKGMERHLSPLWTLKTTYYWTQAFPAGKEVVVDHAYRPSVGLSAGTLIGLDLHDNPWALEAQRAEMDLFCVEPSLLASLQRAAKQADPPSGPPFSDARIEYVLKTGANWNGPIGSFTLTVDKGAPENLVSFCGDGVKKIAPTRFQMKATDFYPARDLGVLILKPYPKP
ncbi:DUF4424 domain-containing protein [Segnochrobactrum spirostomi]|uniref:DUF4424 domain-containing protein n=1 Tax=Segnochrobactrum spirostomi TaxID=2608987 RepID=UPI001AD7F884|nr:DUF4424 domain-containing protein [Segnochrobactrum spirostomi]